MEKSVIDRRSFLRNIGIASGGLLLSSSPWLKGFAEVDKTVGHKARIGIIGPGSRGQHLMRGLALSYKMEITALADVYQPSIDSALQQAPNAKVYKDYRALLDDKNVDAVVVATPLDRHYQMVIDAFDAGKDVFCEKSVGYTVEQSYKMYQHYKQSGKLFFIGQQRMFDPRYIKAMQLVHDGVIGDVNAIRTFWYRNGDWRRNVPSPELERHINWRLYADYSKGLMTELACHQLQIGTWALRQIPNRVFGHGAITYWKDGREVDDNVSCIYMFDDGKKLNFDSIISNKFYGLEEQIMGHRGTIEPEKGKYYFENIAPAPAILQMINQWENDLFAALPLAGTSWAPETANKNSGEYILGKKPQGDGTEIMMCAFAEAIITRQQPELIAEEGYYASALSLWGHDAIKAGIPLPFPEEYKLDYLNHKAPR